MVILNSALPCPAPGESCSPSSTLRLHLGNCIASEMQRGRALDSHSLSRHLLSILKELAHSNTYIRINTGGLDNIYIWRLGSSRSVFDMTGFWCKPFILTLHMTTFLIHPVWTKKSSCLSFLEKGTNSIFYGGGGHTPDHIYN